MRFIIRSGLCMAIKLKEAGYSSDDCAVLEKSNSVGGTWLANIECYIQCWSNSIVVPWANHRFANSYPGCQCDVPSFVYSLSFYNYPEWDSFFPNQPQILQ